MALNAARIVMQPIACGAMAASSAASTCSYTERGEQRSQAEHDQARHDGLLRAFARGSHERDAKRRPDSGSRSAWSSSSMTRSPATRTVSASGVVTTLPRDTPTTLRVPSPSSSTGWRSDELSSAGEQRRRCAYSVPVTVGARGDEADALHQVARTGRRHVVGQRMPRRQRQVGRMSGLPHRGRRRAGPAPGARRRRGKAHRQRASGDES